MAKSKPSYDNLSEGFNVTEASVSKLMLVLNEAHHDLLETGVSLFSQTDVSNSWVASYK